MVVRIAICCVLLVGCSDEDLRAPASLPSLSKPFFRCYVQPVLARNCAFMDCHGNDTRPLRIYAEQRFRRGVDWIDYERPITDEEIDSNFQTVLSFADEQDGTTLLAEKPLDVRLGGLFHGAVGMYGPDDVFIDAEDRDYRALRDFALGQEVLDCQPGEPY